MVLSEGSLLTTAPFIMVLQTSVPILSGEIASKRPLPIFRWHLYREVETCDQRQFITRRRGHGVLSSSVLRGESGGRGGDRSPLLGQAGADGRHLLIPADLNIQIRDKLFIHWNLSGETGLARPRWGELSFIHIQEYVGVLKFWADQGEAVVTTYTETLIEFQKNIQIDNRYWYKSEIAT